jgi:hypothetical protein
MGVSEQRVPRFPAQYSLSGPEQMPEGRFVPKDICPTALHYPQGVGS